MSIDLKLRLLGGVPIFVDEDIGHIKPLTLREITSFGYTDYLTLLYFLTLEPEDLLGGSNDYMLTLFDIIIYHGDDDMKNEFISCLRLFLHEDRLINIDEKNHIVKIGEEGNYRIVNRENFDKIREVIKWQNLINKFSQVNDEENSNSQEESDIVKKLKEKRNKSRQAVEEAKKRDGDSEEKVDADISDIISSVSSKSNSLNKISVFDLTIYQVYDEYKRLELIEQYDLGIKSLLAGAKDIKLKHWSSKIDL